MSKLVRKNILELGYSQIFELVEMHMQSIIENINNPNTDPKAKRGLTIKLSFKTDEERQNIQMESKVEPKLAPIETKGVSLMNVRELNPRTGEIIHLLKEVTTEIPGQIDLSGHITEQEVILIGAYADEVIARAKTGMNAVNQDKNKEIAEQAQGGL